MRSTLTTWMITADLELVQSVSMLESSKKPLNIRQIHSDLPSFDFACIESNDILILHCGELGLRHSAILEIINQSSLKLSKSRILVVDDEHSSKRGIELLSVGLSYYFARPLNLNQIELSLELLLIQDHRLQTIRTVSPKTVKSFQKDHPGTQSENGYLTDAGGEEFQRMMKSVMKVSKFDTTILLGGETGTGKSHLAKVIHKNSDRADKPFITINCAAISPTLFESELFGHVRGSFTGADTDRTGKLTEAAEGTLFLDEIDSLPIALQAKLLRVFEEKVYEPVGSNKTLPMKARLIVASNRDLGNEVNEGRFRSDLYYRLNVVSFEIAPLRSRRSLIKPLLNQFLDESSKRLGVSVPVFTPEALELIKSYDWPGNIRELRNVVERAVTLCDADTITPMELTLELQRSKDHHELSCNSPIAGEVPLENSSHRLHDIVEFQERETILNSVTRNGFNLLKSAKDLGISRMTLYKKLEKYDIRRDSLHYAG